jgi:hypothetical protein
MIFIIFRIFEVDGISCRPLSSEIGGNVIDLLPVVASNLLPRLHVVEFPCIEFDRISRLFNQLLCFYKEERNDTMLL